MRDVSSASLPHRSSQLLAALCQHPQKVQAPPRLRMPRLAVAGSKAARSEGLIGFAAACICDRHLLGKD